MAAWPDNPRLIGKNVVRLDGMAKATGKAKYPSDMRPQGTLFGVMLYSPHAHAKITAIDTSAAEKMPGVKALVVIAGEGKTLRYQGDDIAAVAAETEEQARDAARAIKVTYQVLPSVVVEKRAMEDDAPKTAGRANFQKGRAQVTGDPDGAMNKAAARIDAVYSAPVITHVCLETHGLTARWDKDDAITAWASTQAVGVTANELAGKFNVPAKNVTVLTEVMGGGFARSSGPTSGARPPRSFPREPAASPSRCSSTGSKSTWPPATGRASPRRSRSARPGTASFSPSSRPRTGRAGIPVERMS